MTYHSINYTLTVDTANTDIDGDYSEHSESIYNVDANLIYGYDV